MLEFIHNYQTLISSILLIAAGFYGYKKQRALKERELEDEALSRAVKLQFKIEQIFIVLYSHAKTYNDIKEIGEKDHMEAIMSFYGPVLANPYLEKDHFLIDWDDLGKLKFLNIEMEKVRAFYSSYSAFVGFSEHLRSLWADLDPKIITKEIYTISMETFAGFFLVVVTTGVEILEILSEKTKIKTETTKEEKISRLKPLLQEDLNRIKKEAANNKS